MILVTGATGTVGREVVGQLLGMGQGVRALTRDPSKGGIDSKVEVIPGDLMKPDTLGKAVDGVEKIFSLATGAQIPAQEKNLAQAAKKAGVRHVVKLSVLGAGMGSKGTIPSWHEAGERAYQESGIAWTFIRPGSFMSNARSWAATIKSQGAVFSAFGDGRFPPIHPRDIASVAVKALTSPGHEGKAYPLTGPEALSVGQQVQIISEAIGKPIRYVPVTDEAAKDGMVKSGMPAFYADALLQLAGAVRAGGAAQVLPTVEQVTGRKGLTFTEWVRENVAVFR
jgi:(4-alkanoyl-5-oxo-2,5-dihydrofuran-3-yl)methyl phosphate reductase